MNVDQKNSLDKIGTHLTGVEKSQYTKGRISAFEEMEDKCLNKIADLESEADRLHKNFSYERETTVREQAKAVRSILAEVYNLRGVA